MNPSRRFLEARFHRVDTPIAMASLCPDRSGPLRPATGGTARASLG